VGVRSDLSSEQCYPTVLPITTGQIIGTVDRATMQSATRRMAIVWGIGEGGAR